MTNNKLIKISSILYLVSSLLIIPFITSLGGLLLIIGLLLLSYNFLSEEELSKKKVSLIIIAIISCALNIAAAVLLFIAVSEISSVKQINNNSPPLASTESKRIDLLLKLGLGMILISGVLFATTSWEIISNLVKVIVLVVMGGIFLGLSAFSEQKLKIQSTTKAYFILGLAFFLLTWIGIGYFGVFSEWFSYSGAGKNLVYAITFILLSGILYLIANKFKEKEYTYLGHATIYITIYHLLAFLGLDLLTATLVLTVLSLIINVLPNTKELIKIKEINNIASYLYPSIIFTQCFDSEALIVLITCITNICNLLLLSTKEKNTLESILILIINYILILIGILKLSLSVDKTFILFIVISLFSLLMKYNKLNQNQDVIITNQVIFNVIATILVIILANHTPLLLLTAALIYMVINLLNSIDIYKSNDEIDFRYQPIVIFITIMSLVHFININIFYTGDLVAFALTAIIYAVIKHFSKTEKISKYYNIFLIIALIFTYSLNLNYPEIFPAIVLITLSIYLFSTNRKNSTTQKILFYIFILMNIIELVESLGLFGIASTMNKLIILIIFTVLTLLVRDSHLNTINYISLTLPLYGLVNSFDINPTLNIIVNNLFYLYLLFLLLKLIIKDKDIRDIIGTIGIALISLDIITIADLLIGLYVGFLGIVVIFITFNEEEYKKLFYCGVVITILNIIIQLWELWTRVPFWLYLLLVGIAIVAFVTYKEMNKKNEPPKPVENHQPQLTEKEVLSIPLTNNTNPVVAESNNVEQIETNNNQPTNKQEEPLVLKEELTVAKFCPICGTSNIGGNFCRKCGKNLKLK